MTQDRIMEERRKEARVSTLKSGKIVFDNKLPAIDCLIRNLSESGACLQVNSTKGLPDGFGLLIDGAEEALSSRVVWITDTRLGIEFGAASATEQLQDAIKTDAPGPSGKANRASEPVRDELLTLRAALDLVPVGI